MLDPRFPELYPDCAESPAPAGCELVQEPVCWEPDGASEAAPFDPCENPLSSGSFGSSEEQVEYLLWRIEGMGAADRLECMGRRLLGTPYAIDPLGEGQAADIDTDPLYSFDALDCMTYVEEAMALSSGARNFDEFLDRLSAIRYTGGAELYGLRRHFVSIDWLPENARLGYIRDISGEVSGGHLEYTTLEIDRMAWMQAKDFGFFVGSAAIMDLESIGKDEAEYAALGYIPLSHLYSKRGDSIIPNRDLVDSLPDISIALLVRPQGYAEKYGTIVAHMGFLVFERCGDGSRGELMFRHGSSRTGTITEEPFFAYIDSQSKYRAGVTILEIL